MRATDKTTRVPTLSWSKRSSERAIHSGWETRLVEVDKGLVTNWARTQSCRPRQFTFPSTIEELQAAIREASDAGLGIRVIGGGHSWSDAAMTDEWLISLDGLNRVRHVDKAGGTVEVEAGIRLRDLNRILEGHGLALSNLGSVSEQSIAGATSTGTHGSHARRPVLAGMIRSLCLVTAQGELLTIDRQRDEELFRAVGVGLGAFGVIATCTLDVVPAFNLEEAVHTMRFEEACENMLAIVQGSEFTKFWWLPHTDRVQVFTYTPTSKPPNESRLGAWFDRVAVNQVVLPTMLTAGSLWPQVIPSINKLVATTYLQRPNVVKRSHRAFNVAMPARHLEIEYALHAEEAPDALRDLRACIEEHQLHVNFVQEIRFASCDGFFLSPASGRDTCFIGAYAAGSIQERQYLTEVERRMVAREGRPHWGKGFTVEANYLSSVYPHFEDFISARQTLDPDGRFTSPFLRRVLGID